MAFKESYALLVPPPPLPYLYHLPSHPIASSITPERPWNRDTQRSRERERERERERDAILPSACTNNRLAWPSAYYSTFTALNTTVSLITLITPPSLAHSFLPTFEPSRVGEGKERSADGRTESRV